MGNFSKPGKSAAARPPPPDDWKAFKADFVVKKDGECTGAGEGGNTNQFAGWVPVINLDEEGDHGEASCMPYIEAAAVNTGASCPTVG